MGKEAPTMNKKPPVIFWYSRLGILLYSVNAGIERATKHADCSLEPKVYFVFLTQEINEESLHYPMDPQGI
ncbi:hypothetical protein RRF57_001394 [Xylaria bambusicola]|uniref:Uncharacterized protein n=1 Tax=Xylaria bambusicola TaxID=326684 RepID=A0AAN7UBT7_9PEZI